MPGQTIHGKIAGELGSKAMEIGSHGDAFPEPKDFCTSADTTYTGDIKYLYGHGTGGTTCTINFKAAGIGLQTGVQIIGIYPCNASSVTWTSGGDLTVY